MIVRAQRFVSAVLQFVVGNVHLLLFLAGFVWFYVGLSSISVAAANVTGGGLLMVLAVFPKLRGRGDGHTR